ncbi:polysaccharide lyase family 4 protein [Streptomyces sp. 150FB]|uniref:polysaccharide lyase family protein n=1 Tax=Streptomyces sp. 150FB TaxID=1576605 RepID=UPI000ACAB537|nr:polysaccharide lyase family 4 protein [Streptomyces sp. 150FB]
MSWQRSELSRRSTLGLIGAGAAATVWSSEGSASATSTTDAARGSSQSGAAVQVLINGRPARVGTYAFPTEVDELVLDNGLVRYAFGRDDAAGGVVTGWTDVSITATSVIVDGTELGHKLNGVDPRDPDRQHSFYVDAGGGKTRLVCTQVRVLRVEHGLVEVAFVDVTSTPLQHEHHLIMRSGKRGLYGYDILSASAATSISEVRMNTRWDRGILDHSFNWERGKGQQPTYAYLATQKNLADETWLVDGVNNPDLPSPESNAGGTKAGDVYTKYDWSLYHFESPMFGHYGNGFGTWFTPLGGVSDQTLSGFYGVGPQRQDLAIHQDALILNYFSPNHYGLPGYALPIGYRRLYGPWFSYVTVGDPRDPDALIADAARIAQQEIEENRAGSSWVSDSLYPRPAERTTVSGKVRISDGRPGAGLWALLSTQDVEDVYSIHEAAYFVRTDEDGSFSIPGVPPAWRPGTTDPGTYTLYVFSADGSVTDQYKLTGIDVRGSRHNLGTLLWSPVQRSTFLWQIGRADRTGGEYALASKSPARPSPRDYWKPTLIPGDLSFTIGRDWEPESWYYAHPNPGTWTVHFPLDRLLDGTAFLTVSSSMQQGTPPTVSVNGTSAGIVGSLPNHNDSTIGRQADRSGYPRQALLTFPASLLTVGDNTISFTNGGAVTPDAVEPSSSGFGWDTLLLEVDGAGPAKPARLSGRVTSLGSSHGTSTWQIEITNKGSGPANDVRLDAVHWSDGRRTADKRPLVDGADPNSFPVPVAASISPGASATATLRIAGHGSLPNFDVIELGFFANGGRIRGSARSRRAR